MKVNSCVQTVNAYQKVKYVMEISIVRMKAMNGIAVKIF